jgi:integrase
MPLTDTAVRNAKPGSKPYKLTDGGGLYLLINTAGKYWRFDYRFAGKRKTLAVGVYPTITLAKARERREEARKLLAHDTDPSMVRAVQKQTRQQAAANSFEAVAREWHGKKKPGWAPATAQRMLRSLENNVFPWIGSKPISEIKPTELLSAIRNAESRGALDLAHRLREMAGQVFRYAVATGRAERDPSGDLRGALPPVRVKHYASVTDPEQVAALLRAIDGYSGSFVTLCALQLAPLVFVRPGELRHAEWSEFNLDAAEWRIPGHKMKMQDKHIVPLSQQAMEVLRAVQPLTGSGRYVFPSVRTTTRPMSENTVNAALRRLGYEKNEMTGHGFRSMASTILHEQGWPHEAIERQLAHAERNAVSAAYNYAEHLPKRREMMQAWADYLEALKSGAKVTLINRKRA